MPVRNSSGGVRRRTQAWGPRKADSIWSGVASGCSPAAPERRGPHPGQGPVEQLGDDGRQRLGVLQHPRVGAALDRDQRARRARRAASTAVRVRHGHVAVAVDDDHRDARLGRAPRASAAAAAERIIETAGPEHAATGRVAWPTSVGRRPAGPAWPPGRGCAATAASTACRPRAARPRPASTGGAKRDTLMSRSQQLADDGVDEHHGDGPVGVAGRPAGPRAGRPSSGRRTPPGGCPARRAPGPAARRRTPRSSPPVGRPWVPPWPATSMATTLKPMRDQPGQRLGVEDALGREPVDQHQRHAPAAHRHARPGGRRRARSRGGPAGARPRADRSRRPPAGLDAGHRGAGSSSAGAGRRGARRCPGPMRRHRRVRRRLIGDGSRATSEPGSPLGSSCATVCPRVPAPPRAAGRMTDTISHRNVSRSVACRHVSDGRATGAVAAARQAEPRTRRTLDVGPIWTTSASTESNFTSPRSRATNRTRACSS